MKKFASLAMTFFIAQFPSLRAHGANIQAPAITCWTGYSPPRSGWAIYIKSASDTYSAKMDVNTAADGGDEFMFPKMDATILNENPVRLSYEGVGTDGNRRVHVELKADALLNPGVGCLGRSAFGAYNDCEFRGTFIETDIDSRNNRSYIVECNRLTTP